jgi:ankyrin repeat protein
MVELLIQTGADLEARSGINEGTALLLAAERGHLEVVALLLAAGADVQATDFLGASLRDAVPAEKRDLLREVLLRHGFPESGTADPAETDPTADSTPRRATARSRP